MSKSFNTTVTTSVNATIDSNSVARIIEEEVSNLFCGEYRFSKEVVLKIRDNSSNETETTREATKEEVELYDALWMVYDHFKKLK